MLMPPEKHINHAYDVIGIPKDAHGESCARKDAHRKLRTTKLAHGKMRTRKLRTTNLAHAKVPHVKLAHAKVAHEFSNNQFSSIKISIRKNTNN